MKNAEVACCANLNGHEKDNLRQGIGNFEIDEVNEKKYIISIFIVKVEDFLNLTYRWHAVRLLDCVLRAEFYQVYNNVEDLLTIGTCFLDYI